MSDSVKVKILGDDSDLQSTLTKASKSVLKWSSIAVTAATAAGVAMVKSGLESADALAKESAQLSTTSEDLMTLKRASDLAGVSQATMSVAARTLKTRMGEVAQGTGEAVGAFDALGISLEDLEGLSVSEQIALINKSLSENVDANERAAVAADLFGSRAGLAIANISPETIQQAAQQVDDFGAALSAVDAAKIENANDTMSQMGLLTQSVTQTMAAKFAPVLDSVAGKLFDAAKESDGFKDAIDGAFDAAVTGAGFVADSFHAIQIAIKASEVGIKGIGSATTEVTESAVQAWDDLGNTVTENINEMIRAVNNIPGVNIDEVVSGESEALAKIKSFNKSVNESFEESKQEFIDLWNEPLPSEGLKAWVKEAEDSAEKAAQAAVKARESIASSSGVSSDGEQITSTAEDAEKDAAQSNLDTVSESLKSEAQLRWEAEDAAYQALIEGLNLKLITKEEYLEKEAALTQKYREEDLERQKELSDAEVAIAQAAYKAKMAVASSGFGNLASLMDTESRKLFEIGKAAALSQATIDGYAAITSSYKHGAAIGGPVVGAAYAATAAVATGVQISKIASTSFGSSSSGTSSSSSTSTTTDESASTTSSTQSVSISLQGDTYSKQSVESLIEELNEAVANGATIRTT